MGEESQDSSTRLRDALNGCPDICAGCIVDRVGKRAWQVKAHDCDEKASRRSSPLVIVARSNRQPRPWGFLPWLAPVVLLVLVPVATVLILVRYSGRSAKAFLIETLEQRYNAHVQLNDFKFSFGSRVTATGTGLLLRRQGEEQIPPFLSIKSFSAESSILEWLRTPWHVHSVRLVGLEVNIPPRGQPKPAQPKRHHGSLPGFVIDEIHADGTLLTVLPRSPKKLPLTFQIQRLMLRAIGKGQPLSFEAKLANPKPPGEIESQGHFGPWRSDELSLTPVSGQYTFRNADLSVFKGIAGTLLSRGQYKGVLDHIAVQGWTDTPNFSVGISGQPVHLTTVFAAVVDGTDGNTYLQPVKALFLNSTVVATGKVEGRAGKQGKTIFLQVSSTDARVQDLMRLAMKGRTPPLVGAVRLHSLFELPPGSKDIVDRLLLRGDFSLQNARFTNPTVQHKVETLSRRGRGVQSTDDPASVTSNFAGQFRLRSAQMSFPYLSFGVPGGEVRLHGDYGLRSEQLDFRGELRLQARLSQTTHGIKSLLLKPVDPFFRKKGAGTVLPIKVQGERSNPHFGLDLGRLLGGKR